MEFSGGGAGMLDFTGDWESGVGIAVKESRFDNKNDQKLLI